MTGGGFVPALGAVPTASGGCRFRVWAPFAERVEVRIVSPGARLARLEPEGSGYHAGVVGEVPPGALYRFRMDGGRELPDPASRSQPEGVHGPSCVVDPEGHRWTDAGWRGIPLPDHVFYEIHVGTFTPEGTFDAVVPHLDGLADLGVTALQLMPVARFPGSRNWGYDGAYPFAVHECYGGTGGLKRLVDACHRRGLAVVLDAVYNHLGPEGNYLGEFGPYFTDRYRTPWGRAINFDGPDSDEVRRYFLENALRWFDEFHADGLRLDAIHGIFDFSAAPFLAELADRVREYARRAGRSCRLFPESDLNDARVVSPRRAGGFGMDAQWSDDFHHALHALLTGERDGYYRDFGSLGQLARAHSDGYVYSGQYSPHRRRRHGNDPGAVPAPRFVVFAQNHDQVGNRALGERLSALVPFEALKLAAGTVLLSPFLPLLFMGEEYGESAPFLYFVDHSDPTLIEAVRNGRREEFAAFRWAGEPPDPQDPETFRRSRLDRSRGETARGRALRAFHRELLRMRKRHPALSRLDKGSLDATALEGDGVLAVRRWSGDSRVATIGRFGDQPVRASIPLPAGRWRKLLDSADPAWEGPGSRIPDGVESGGSICLDLAPWQFTLLEFAAEEER